MNEIGFTYDYALRDSIGVVLDTWTNHNLIPDVGRNYIIANGLSGGTFYIGIYSVSRTPVAADTMPIFISSCGELSNYATTNSARMSMIGKSAAGIFSNILSPAVFTFISPGDIYGGFVCTDPTISSTTGTLISEESLSTVKHVLAGNTLTVVASIPVISL